MKWSISRARPIRCGSRSSAVLKVKEPFGDAFEGDAVAAEEEVLELEHAAGGLDIGVELRGFVGPPAGDEGRRSGPSEVSASPTPGYSRIEREPVR